MWVKCNICKGSGINPDHNKTNDFFHEGTNLSIYNCIYCYNWYIMGNYSEKGYIWVDDSNDPISPLSSP